MSAAMAWMGGSFDPVHDGHLAIARAAADRLNLEQLLMVPAALPPHKRERRLASGEDRLALLAIACADDPRLQPSNVELLREGPSYSYHTALELRRRYGDDTPLFFIVGADTLQDLASWYRIAELAEIVTFCPVTRPGSSLDPEFLVSTIGAAAVARIAEHVIAVPPHPGASTAIREALARGEAPEHLPGAVHAAIVERGLYGAGGA